jgi:hypothetical protein
MSSNCVFLPVLSHSSSTSIIATTLRLHTDQTRPGIPLIYRLAVREAPTIP